MDPLPYEHELLTSGLGDLGATWGAIGGRIGRTHAGARSGRHGAEFTAKRLKVHPAEQQLQVRARRDRVLAIVDEAMSELGEQWPPEQEAWSSALPNAAIVMGSGWANMNPAIVQCEVMSTGSGSTVSIRAAALEGLIKQKTAAKAVRRLAERIQQSLA